MDLDYLFWEILPNDVFYIVDTSPVYKCFQSVKFSRDDNYRLICELTGNKSKDSKHPMEIFDKGYKAGELIMGTGIGFDAKSRGGALNVKIEDVYLNSINNNLAEPDGIIIGKGVAKRMILTCQSTKDKSGTFICWFLNSPGRGVAYTRVTEFETGGKAVRKIKDVYEDSLDRPVVSSFTSRDSILLEVKGKKFVFGTVDDKRTKGLGGSYLRFLNKYIPSKDELYAIQNFLTYFFGIELIQVGHTIFGENNSILEQVYLTSWKDDLKKTLNANSREPIPLDWHYAEKLETERFEELISKLLSAYYDNNKTFNLDIVIFYVSESWHLALNIMAQPLFTAIDLLQQAWFKSALSLSKGRALKDGDYDSIIKKYIPGIEKDLNGKDLNGAIIKKIKMANIFSLSERNKVFFDELGLGISDVEERVMTWRNKITHGSLEEYNYQELLSITYASYALLNRIMLKLLGYTEDYIDYSTYNFPARNIAEPLKGPRGDGKI